MVTFSHWVNYSPIIVTLPSPSYLASQMELLGFIYRGVTPQSSPVEPPPGIEPSYPDYKSGASPAMLKRLTLLFSPLPQRTSSKGFCCLASFFTS